MKFVFLALTFLLVPLAAANGQPGGSEEQVEGPDILVPDLQTGKQRQFFLLCANYSRSITNCPFPEVWEQTNPLKGLQTSPIVIRGRTFQPDACLLPTTC